ncbi:MAG: hypothetical protein LBT38_04060, partial [Deltaproteobacteria bacterium]|nr:hypothetical protein [Deltaproteobacteria bacterium]
MKWRTFLTLAFLTFFLVSPLLAQKKVPRDKDGDLSDVTVAALNKETTPLSEIDVEIFVKFLEGLHEQLLAN